MQVYVVVGIAAVAFTGFLLMLVILKFGGNSKFGIKGKTPDFYLNRWLKSWERINNTELITRSDANLLFVDV